MAEALVRGVHINYEVIGSSGPWIALTPGSRRSFAELRGISQALAAEGYRVLLHDRRNCGASDVAFDGSGSEHEVWADDLHELARQLDALPIIVGGSSAGARLAIVFALRHPKALCGLLLWRLTGGQHAVDRLAENYYGQFIKIVRQGGMKAICESEHFAGCIKARPDNRERLMQTDPDEFVKVMTTWRECFLQSATLPIVGATEAQLRGVTAPVCLIAGNDVVHTPVTARKAAGLFPNNEFHDDVVRKLADDKLLHDWDQDEWRSVEPRLVEIFGAFLKRNMRAAAA
ncbi:MAG: alpha/beta hydrolase [Xanthobacteraceae bacterium]|nr:alpha/beta hydrolase [Xanthobacteraceae bacterium]